MKHQYDWSQLDAGWSVDGDTLRYADGGEVFYESPVSKLESIAELDYGRYHPDSPLAQLAKCRVVDTTLFETMDKMAVEVPEEEWAKIPPIGNGETVSFNWDPATGKILGEPQVTVAPSPISSESWVLASSNAPQLCSAYPTQPWRRGPLAAWTLVNISCHDGRLTVVMRRGRGELVIETGPDDETLWERLGAKAVDVDKAKAAEEAKEKSNP